jgi:hypothetical protein
VRRAPVINLAVDLLLPPGFDSNKGRAITPQQNRFLPVGEVPERALGAQHNVCTKPIDRVLRVAFRHQAALPKWHC